MRQTVIQVTIDLKPYLRLNQAMEAVEQASNEQQLAAAREELEAAEAALKAAQAAQEQQINSTSLAS